VHPRLFQLGSLAIPTSGALTAIAILAALFTARTAARRLDLDAERVWDLGIAGVITALIAPRLILIVTNWSDFLAHPLWMLGLISVRSQAAVAGGMALAIVAMLIYAKFAQLPLGRTLDALAPAFALGYAITSIGSFLAGTDFGTPTHLPWAVTYTKRLASLWYGTPLGTPLHPVQLYQALLEVGLFALLLEMIALRKRWKLRDGEIMGAWLFLSGISTFFLNFLRGDLATTSPNGFPLAQSLALCMVLIGGLFSLF
jgi:phosphatidylglycerol:prolipoprotein diacylglycerol transferase